MNSVVRQSLDVFFNPCAQMQDMLDIPPFEVVAAKGVWMERSDGRQVLDGISSWWCKSLGHGHPRLLQALRDQAEQFEHVIAANTTHRGMVKLCQRLLAIANGHGVEQWGPDAPDAKPTGKFSRVFLADNGSTAIEIALKMAIQSQKQWGYERREQFACLQGGYHGESIATLAVGDCDIYSAPFRPLMFPSLRLDQLPLRQGPEDPLWMDCSAEWPGIEAQLASQADELAAIIYEPVLQGAGGMRLLSPDLPIRLRRWADDHGVLLIADEIAAGFGRCGTMLASQLAHDEGLPDLCCISKGLTGGVSPLSAVLLTEDIYQAFWGAYSEGKSFLHSNTWTGHPLGIAVANAVLDEMAETGLCAQVQERGRSLRDCMAKLAAQWPCIGPVRGVGMVAAMDLQGFPSGDRYGRKVFRAALEEDLFLRGLGDTVYCFPPLTISRDEIDILIDRLGRSLEAVLGPRAG